MFSNPTAETITNVLGLVNLVLMCLILVVWFCLNSKVEISKGWRIICDRLKKRLNELKEENSDVFNIYQLIHVPYPKLKLKQKLKILSFNA